MNERLTQVEIKYRNKLKLDSIEKRIEVLSSAVSSIETVIIKLYITLSIDIPLIADDLDKTILRSNDILGG